MCTNSATCTQGGPYACRPRGLGLGLGLGLGQGLDLEALAGPAANVFQLR